ncbi:MAG TPA: serpin family protein [Blastocatellia bacterium]|nr:serpin family protein [Blastocatellia bacterium]
MRRILTGFVLFAIVTAILATSVLGTRSSRDRDSTTSDLPTKIDENLNGGNGSVPTLNTNVDGYNKFGFDIFKQLISHHDNGNLIISGVSISSALAMTMNGAGGATRKEMASVVGQSGLNTTQFDQFNFDLLKGLESSDPSVSLSIANSIWARKGVHFYPDFLKRDHEFFKAEITSLDFADPGSLATINGWVSKNTNGKINKIVERLTPDSVMMLVNAVYFKGKWQNEFKKSDTNPEDFRTDKGKTIKVPMMSQPGRYLYQKGDHWQAVSLPYGSGRFSLYVFLPDGEAKSLNGFLATLNQETWNTWMNGFHEQPGTIKIPRFKMESDENLVPSLKKLGMVSAFDPEHADFSAMSREPLYIEIVKHKAVIDVNEEGTEAAAATAVGVARATAMMPPPPFEFIADHPFFIAIRDSQTGALLFIGTVSDPESN